MDLSFITRWFVVCNEAIGQNKKGVTFCFYSLQIYLSDLPYSLIFG